MFDSQVPATFEPHDQIPEDYIDDWDDVCGECGGEGYILDDCFEDTCCCADPEKEHGYITCPTCEGK